MELSLRTQPRHPQRLRRKQLQRGGTQLEDDQEPGNKFVNDFIHDFGGKVLFMETFALCRWHALRWGIKRLQTFPPPARGVYQVSYLSSSYLFVLSFFAFGFRGKYYLLCIVFMVCVVVDVV